MREDKKQDDDEDDDDDDIINPPKYEYPNQKAIYDTSKKCILRHRHFQLYCCETKDNDPTTSSSTLPLRESPSYNLSEANDKRRQQQLYQKEMSFTNYFGPPEAEVSPPRLYSSQSDGVLLLDSSSSSSTTTATGSTTTTNRSSLLRSSLRQGRFSNIPSFGADTDGTSSQQENNKNRVSFQPRIDIHAFDPAPFDNWAPKGWSSWFNAS